MTIANTSSVMTAYADSWVFRGIAAMQNWTDDKLAKAPEYCAVKMASQASLNIDFTALRPLYGYRPAHSLR